MAVKITVKLFAGLQENRGRQKDVQLPDGSTPKDLLKELGIPAEQVNIIMINGKRAKEDIVMKENDIVALFPLVGGG